MNGLEFWFRVIQILVSAITPVVAFILGRRSTLVDRKRERIKEQFCSFYHPYVLLEKRNLYRSINGEQNGVRKEIDKILFENAHFASAITQEMILKYFDTLMQADSDDKRAVAAAELSGILLSKHIFSEYKSLCLKLHLPQPTLPPLDALIQKYRNKLLNTETRC